VINNNAPHPPNFHKKVNFTLAQAMRALRRSSTFIQLFP